MMRSRGIIICSVLVLGGCHTLMPVELPTTKTVMIERERLPHGEPTSTLQADAANRRWTVDVRQAYTIRTDTMTVQKEGVRRYLWWPLAPLNGILQCPIGILASTVSDSTSARTLRQVGCMRLIGMEPLQGVAEHQTHTTTSSERHEDTAPAAGIEVTFTPDLSPDDILRTVTGRDGAMTLTHQRIHTSTPAPITGRLDVNDNHKTILSRSITITPDPADPFRNPKTARPVLPANDPIIVQIEPFTREDGTPDPTLHPALIATLLRAGITVIANQTDTQQLAQEIGLQQGLRIDDAAKVRLGRLTQPTIVIEGKVRTTNQIKTLTASLYLARTGERIVLNGLLDRELGESIKDMLTGNRQSRLTKTHN